MHQLCSHSTGSNQPPSPTQSKRALEIEQVAGEPFPGSKSTLWKWELKSLGVC